MEKRQRGTFVKAVVDRMFADNAERSKAIESEQPPTRVPKPENLSRRSFFGRVGGVAAVAATAGTIVLKPLLGGKDSVADASVVGYGSAIERAKATATGQARRRLKTSTSEFSLTTATLHSLRISARSSARACYTTRLGFRTRGRGPA